MSAVIDLQGRSFLNLEDFSADEIVYRLAPEDPTPKPGERVSLRIREGKAHWFVDGRRI